MEGTSWSVPGRTVYMSWGVRAVARAWTTKNGLVQNDEWAADLRSPRTGEWNEARDALCPDCVPASIDRPRDGSAPRPHIGVPPARKRGRPMSAPGCGAGQVEGPVPAPRPAGASGSARHPAPNRPSPDAPAPAARLTRPSDSARSPSMRRSRRPRHPGHGVTRATSSSPARGDLRGAGRCAARPRKSDLQRLAPRNTTGPGRASLW